MDSRFAIAMFLFVLIMNNEIMFCESDMSCDSFLPEVCDYIIVGAGAAGATVAGRLSEDPSVKVCLFEAGLSDTNPEVAPLIETPILWTDLLAGPITYNYTTVPQRGLNGRTVAVGMGKALGGSTSHNVMAFFRGFKADFDCWAAQGATGWSFNDVLPYFLKLEDNISPDLKNSPIHSTCGPFRITTDPNLNTSSVYSIFKDAAKETGLPVVECNDISPFGICPVQQAVRDGQRESSSSAYLKPAAGRPNLYIVTEALVEKILISKYQKRAYGIRYSKDGQTHQIKARREIIISGGSYSSVQLLQLSGIGPESLLRKHKIRSLADLPVGYNLQDHVVLTLDLLIDTPVITQEKLNDPKVLAEYIYKRTGIYAIPGAGNFVIFFDTKRPNFNWPKAQVLFTEVPSLQTIRPRNSTSIFIFYSHPVSRGTVLIKSNDPSDPPLIDPRYLQEETDIQGLIDVVRSIQKLTKAPSLQDVKAKVVPKTFPQQCRRFKPDSNDQWKCLIRNTANRGTHPVGTCRMGNVRNRATVVDTKLRVLGIKGLRVADASVMPEVTSANTMAPSLMIGEKAADLIKKDYETH